MGRSPLIDLSFHQGVLRIHVTGPSVHEREVPIMQREINGLIAILGARLSHLELDLTELQIMPSLLLGMCVELRQQAADLGAKTTVRSDSELMSTVLLQLKLLSPVRPNRLSRFFGRVSAA